MRVCQHCGGCEGCGSVDVRKRAGFELALESQGHWSWGCRAGSDLRSPQGAYLFDMRLIACLEVEINFDFPPCLSGGWLHSFSLLLAVPVVLSVPVSVWVPSVCVWQ